MNLRHTAGNGTTRGAVAGGFVAAGVINDSGSGDGADMVVTKFAADDGASNHKEWVRTWNGPAGLNDTTWAVTSDLQGGVTVCGYTLTASGRRDWEIVKWSAAGAFQWAETYPPDLANSRATATDVCCDGAGDVYVCGSTQTAANAASLVVRKLDGGSGATLWEGRYEGPDGSFNQGLALGRARPLQHRRRAHLAAHLARVDECGRQPRSAGGRPVWRGGGRRLLRFCLRPVDGSRAGPTSPG